MGLDQFIEHKKAGNDVLLLYFRKYYELDEWVRANCSPLGDSNDIFKITSDDLKELRHELERVFTVIKALPLIAIVDENYDLTKKQFEIVRLVNDSNFLPIGSTSWNSGNKFLKLYYGLETLEDELLYANENDEHYLKYTSSY